MLRDIKRVESLCVYVYRRDLGGTQAGAHQVDIALISFRGQFARATHTIRNLKGRSLCPCFMKHEIKPAEFQAAYCGDKILSP